jgi:hypothetical protein
MHFFGLYRDESYNAKYNAQRNLSTRTHYVDNDTLKYFKARITYARHTHDGRLFCIVESLPIGGPDAARGFRFKVFDLVGNVLNHDNDTSYKTSAQALQAMREFVDGLDSVALNVDALHQHWQSIQAHCEHVAQALA